MTAMNMNRNKLNTKPGNFFRKVRAVALMITALFLFSGGSVFAQDAAAPAPATAPVAAAASNPVEGQTLFKENCATCHKIDQDMTGPMLKGVEDRVPGGRKWIYAWVKNSPAVLASGDKYANDLFVKWKKVPMTTYPNFTDAQIDNILDYINISKAPVVVGATKTPNLSDNKGLTSMWNWIRFLIILVVILLFNIAVLVTNLRGVEFLKGLNLQLWNSRGLMLFYILGMAGTAWLSYAYRNNMALITNPASEHGIAIDQMFWITMWITIAVFVVVNFALFYFGWKYSKDGERKATYYPENHKLELLWTIVPAIVLTILIAFGIVTWNKIMVHAPDKNAYNLELNAQQFAWNIHYPGVDNNLGDVDVHLISPTNLMGVNFQQDLAHDDFMANEIYLPKGKPVTLTIRSRDVIHAVHMPHFRVKMDAVPGMKTRFTFVPILTTAEMRIIRNEETFNYELACAEVCGKSHFSMQKKITVVEEAEYLEWIKKQPVMFDPKVHILQPTANPNQHASATQNPIN